MRRIVALALLALSACADEVTRPRPTIPQLAITQSEEHGPPPPHAFGPDSYAVGAFTGEGVDRPGLSCQKSSAELRECTGFLASAVDGALLDVIVQIPLKFAKPLPLVVVVHGYGASKASSGNVVQPLLDEGYAVLRYSTRGFGNSWGQVNLVDLHAEVADLRSMIGQVIDEPQLHLDPSRVAVTGTSYGGGHSWLAALEPVFTTPRGSGVHIRTVVPIAGWSDLVYSLLPNGRERESIDAPGGAKLSYINGLYASGIRDNPSRPYNNYPPYFIGWHAWINAQEPNDIDPLFRSIVDGLAGYRSVWWQQSFWAEAPTSRIPVLIVQGFTDDLFPLPEAKRMLLALRSLDPRYPVAAYFGDLGHPRASNKPGEIDYVLGLIKSWLAHYVKGEGATPPSVVYAALTRPRDEPFDAGNVTTAPTLAELATTTVSTQFDALPAVLVNPLTDPAGGFFWDPLVMEGARELQPLPVPPESPLVPGSLATYEVSVAELSGGGTLVIAGQPTVSLHISTVSHRVQLNVRLFEVDAAGTKHLITRGTYTVEASAIGLPIGDADVVIPTYGNYWRAESGSTLRLELTNVDSPYITPSRVPSATIVTDVRLTVPLRQ
ncbi:MAG TPA: alpha/beta fold hydrolase [Gemmatimonadaceae bacterium]|nr:alpha/beta fold hydrolase [Gemmatimonadaceae bacterium]